jgi:hypothetical protein
LVRGLPPSPLPQTHGRRPDNGYALSRLLLMGNTTDFTGTPLEPLMSGGMFRHFRSIFRGKPIANVGMTAERGNRLTAKRLADLVAFGRSCIANLDRVERLATGAPLAEGDSKTVYASESRRLFRLSNYPSGGGRVNSTRGLLRIRPIT